MEGLVWAWLVAGIWDLLIQGNTGTGLLVAESVWAWLAVGTACLLILVCTLEDTLDQQRLDSTGIE